MNRKSKGGLITIRRKREKAMRKVKRFFALALALAVTMTSAEIPVYAVETGAAISEQQTETKEQVEVTKEEVTKEQLMFNKALEEDGVVTLSEDLTVKETIELNLPKEATSAGITLDLAGYTLTDNSVGTILDVEEGITLNIVNGSIYSDTDSAVVIDNEGILVLDEVEIVAEGETSVAILNNSSAMADGVVINSAVIKGDSYAVASTIVSEGTSEDNNAQEDLQTRTEEDDQLDETTLDTENNTQDDTTANSEDSLQGEYSLGAKSRAVTVTAVEVEVETNGGMDIPVGDVNSHGTLNAPTGLAVQVINYKTVSVTWNAVEEADCYNLYRSSDGTNFALVSANTKNLSYTDMKLTPGITYYYKITAKKNDTKEEKFSSAVTVKTEYAAPTAVKIAIVNATSVKITWSASTGASSYAIYRSTSASSGFAKIGTSNSTYYTDTTAVPGTTYYYKTAAANATYVGPQSTAASAKTTLAKPTSLKAKVNSYNSVSLTWKSATGATQYEVYRSTKKNSGYKKIATVNTTSYTAKKLKINTKYYFKIKAKAGNYTSTYSNAVNAKTALTSPTNLKATVTSYNKVKLTWTKTTGAKKYKIYRSTKKNSGYKLIGTTTRSSYTNKNLTTGKTYYYKIKAVRGKVSSSYSSRVKAKPVTKATNLTVESSNYNTIKLKWTKVTGAQKYIVYRSTKEKSGYKKLETTKELTYTDSKVTSGRTYYYKVVGVRGKVKGTGAIKSAKAVTNAPGSFMGDSITKTAIQITWAKPDGATSYIVYRSTDGGKSYKKLGTTANLKYTDEGLKFGNTYHYKVSSVRNGVEGKLTSALALVATIPSVGDLSVKCTSVNDKEIKLKWTRPDEYDNFQIYRSISPNAGYSLYATVKRNSYTDEISEDRVYYYRVYATLGGIKSNYKQAQYAFASKIKLNKTSKTVNAGETYTLTAKFTPNETTDKTLTWTTSDASVATVANGVVTGIKAGTATITATTINGKTATCKIKVKGKSNSIVIVLDPGHGGLDPGNVSSGYKEKDMNLKVAQYCKAELEKYEGVSVYMTRTSDTYVALDDRPAYAKEKGADMFVSLHMNSVTDTSPNGAEVYASVNNTYISSTSKLASKVLDNLVGLGLSSRGVKTRTGDNGDYYAVIRGSVARGFGGILIEHAFMSNPSNLNYLSKDANLKALGAADAKGIAEYYGLSKK